MSSGKRPKFPLRTWVRDEQYFGIGKDGETQDLRSRDEILMSQFQEENPYVRENIEFIVEKYDKPNVSSSIFTNVSFFANGMREIYSNRLINKMDKFEAQDYFEENWSKQED